MSRQIVALMLASLLIIAMFNVVTSLVLVVSDRRAPSSMLRAIGFTSSDIAQIFVIQGTMIGVGGAVLGAGLGLLLALVTPSLVQFIELGTGSPLLDTAVYPLAMSQSTFGWKTSCWSREWLWCSRLCLALCPRLQQRDCPLPKDCENRVSGIAISLAFFQRFSLTTPACSLRNSLRNTHRHRPSAMK